MEVDASFLVFCLRFSGQAAGCSNHLLGSEIRNLVARLGGYVIFRRRPCDWRRHGVVGNLGRFELPATSARYFVPFHRLAELYFFLFQHP